jgi:hypothetical protein
MASFLFVDKEVDQDCEPLVKALVFFSGRAGKLAWYHQSIYSGVVSYSVGCSSYRLPCYSCTMDTRSDFDCKNILVY